MPIEFANKTLSATKVANAAVPTQWFECSADWLTSSTTNSQMATDECTFEIIFGCSKRSFNLENPIAATGQPRSTGSSGWHLAAKNGIP